MHVTSPVRETVAGALKNKRSDGCHLALVCDIFRKTFTMFQSEGGINCMVIESISFQADSEEAVSFISTFIPLFEVDATSRFALAPAYPEPAEDLGRRMETSA